MNQNTNFVPDWVQNYLQKDENPTPISRLIVLFHWSFFLLAYAFYVRVIYQYEWAKIAWRSIVIGSLLAIFIYQPSYIPSVILDLRATIVYWFVYMVLYGHLLWVIYFKRSPQLFSRKLKDNFMWLIFILTLFSFLFSLERFIFDLIELTRKYYAKAINFSLS